MGSESQKSFSKRYSMKIDRAGFHLQYIWGDLSQREGDFSTDDPKVVFICCSPVVGFTVSGEQLNYKIFPANLYYLLLTFIVKAPDMSK